MDQQEKHTLVLAIAPTIKGFGYTVFEGPDELIEWSISNLTSRQRLKEGIARVEELIDFYEPEVVVIENAKTELCRKARKTVQFLAKVEKLSGKLSIPCHAYTREEIKEVFGRLSFNTKYEIAKGIAGFIPYLKARLPPDRKPWMSEDYRMGIFEAASLAYVYYYREDSGGLHEAVIYTD